MLVGVRHTDLWVNPAVKGTFSRFLGRSFQGAASDGAKPKSLAREMFEAKMKTLGNESCKALRSFLPALEFGRSAGFEASLA